MEKKYFLTIAIPTFERTVFLDKTLESIVTQDAFTDEIEILICDNSTNCDTRDMMQSKYALKYPNIRYIKNETNIGTDRNILKLLNVSKGEYIKLLNDNKPFRPDALAYLLSILKKEKPSVFLTFNGVIKLDTEECFCNDINFLLSKSSYWITWLPITTIKSEIVKEISRIDEEIGSSLFQVDLVLKAINLNKHVVISNKCILDDLVPETKGGYNLFDVFVNNYLGILRKYVRQGSLHKDVFRKEKNSLLLNFIFQWIVISYTKRKIYKFQISGVFRIIFYYIYFLFGFFSEY